MRSKIIKPPTFVLCAALTYGAHREEVKDRIKPSSEMEGFPVFFIKSPTAVILNGEAIQLPDIRNIIKKKLDAPYGYVNGEAELAIVIKKETHNVSPKEAKNHILGYTAFNDVTQRDIQSANPYYLAVAKGFPTFAPVGPVIISPDEVGNPDNLSVELRVNGKTYQKASTSDMDYTVAELVSLASRVYPLKRDDIITVGSPPGMTSRFRPGDTVEVEIERIGILKNPVEFSGRQ